MEQTRDFTPEELGYRLTLLRLEMALHDKGYSLEEARAWLNTELDVHILMVAGQRTKGGERVLYQALKTAVPDVVENLRNLATES